VKTIGLTGGIASGKTAVSDMLAARGLAIVDTDLLAREVVEPGTPGLAAIATAFGPAVLAADGSLDRAALGAIVFEDAAARATLNAITHPRIRELMTARVAAHAAAGARGAVLVVPLLFENGLDAMVDESWVVDVPETVQKQRLMARNGLSEAEADARIASQLPRDAKRAKATRVIANQGDLAALGVEVERVLAEAGLA